MWVIISWYFVTGKIWISSRQTLTVSYMEGEVFSILKMFFLWEHAFISVYDSFKKLFDWQEKGAEYPPPPPPQQQAPPPPYSQGHTGLPAEQPQPAGYFPPQPVQPPPQTVVVNTVSRPAAMVVYRDVPVMVQCPNCNNHVTSKVVFENGLLVWICVLAIAFLFQ